MKPQDILPDATADELRAVIHERWISRILDADSEQHELENILKHIRVTHLLSECDRLSQAMQDNIASRGEFSDDKLAWLKSAEKWARLNTQWESAMAKVDRLQGRI